MSMFVSDTTLVSTAVMSETESATPMIDTMVRVRLRLSERSAKREKMLILPHPRDTCARYNCLMGSG